MIRNACVIICLFICGCSGGNGNTSAPQSTLLLDQQSLSQRSSLVRQTSHVPPRAPRPVSAAATQPSIPRLAALAIATSPDEEDIDAGFVADPVTTCKLQAGLISPVIGTPSVISPYGDLRNRGNTGWYAHTGTDISYAANKPVYAAQSGTVQQRIQGGTTCATKAGYGCYIIVSQGSEQTLYAHLSSFVAANGSTVTAGQQIAVSGTSGNADGGAPHVHFELSTNGSVLSKQNKINPCGATSDAPDGTLASVPDKAAHSTYFTSLSLDLQSVTLNNPAATGNLRAASTHSLAFDAQQYADSTGQYYLVTCGHVIIGDPSTHPRWSGPYAPGSGPVTVSLVGFLNASKWGPTLTSPVSGTNAPCPAPAAPTFGPNALDVTFYAPGQINESYWCRSDGMSDTVTATVANPAIASVNPVNVGVYQTQTCNIPTFPNPPDPHYRNVAGSVGSTTVTDFDKLTQQNFFTYAVTVVPTPTPAPVPSPLS